MLRIPTLSCMLWFAACSGSAADRSDAALVIAHADASSTADDSGHAVSDADSARKTNADSVTPLPACTWNAANYHTDGSSDLCFAARTDMVCADVNGCTVQCLVNDPSSCPGPSNASCFSSSGGSGETTCEDTCNADEYAVECEASGQLGNGPFGTPPSGSGCRPDTAAPASAEAAYYCCPCGS